MRAPLLPGIVLVVVLAGGVSACTSQEPEPAASGTVHAEATPTPTPTVDPEEAVLTAFQRYWDAQVEAQRGNPDPALFDGVAQGPIVEDAIAAARDFESKGIVREGQPTLTQQTVTIDADTATVFACVDNSTWTVPGQVVPEGVSLVQPGGLTLVRTDESWIVSGSVKPPAEFTC